MFVLYLECRGDVADRRICRMNHALKSAAQRPVDASRGGIRAEKLIRHLVGRVCLLPRVVYEDWDARIMLF